MLTGARGLWDLLTLYVGFSVAYLTGYLVKSGSPWYVSVAWAVLAGSVAFAGRLAVQRWTLINPVRRHTRRFLGGIGPVESDDLVAQIDVAVRALRAATWPVGRRFGWGRAWSAFCLTRVGGPLADAHEQVQMWAAWTKAVTRDYPALMPRSKRPVPRWTEKEARILLLVGFTVVVIGGALDPGAGVFYAAAYGAGLGLARVDTYVRVAPDEEA